MASAPVPPSGLLKTWNVQACCSWDTLADEITEPGACRVLAMSALGYGHDPDGGAALGLVVVAGWWWVAVGLLLQAAASKTTRTTSMLIPIRVRLKADIATLP
jgi:hypothetical protein